MIYQVYGFNIKCDYYIEYLKDYISMNTDTTLPLIDILTSSRLDNDIVSQAELKNDDVHGFFAPNKTFLKLKKGLTISISNNCINMGGKSINYQEIGEEINGPSIIITSRYNGRAVLHGSAFLYKEKAYLIIALPGSGKSTLTAAMAKHRSDILLITDDIICVSSDGTSIYRGVHGVNLNADSLNELFSDNNKINGSFIKKGINEPKTFCFGDTLGKVSTTNSFKIGGVFFLQSPLESGLISFEKLNEFDFFCDLIKNIKLKSLMPKNIMLQEMNILDKVSKTAFATKIQIIHDYTKLNSIEDTIVDYIDEQQLRL